MDVNYVLARATSLEVARQQAQELADKFKQETYISFEYEVEGSSSANTCGCVGGSGACVENRLCICAPDCGCKNLEITVEDDDQEEPILSEENQEAEEGLDDEEAP